VEEAVRDAQPDQASRPDQVTRPVEVTCAEPGDGPGMHPDFEEFVPGLLRFGVVLTGDRHRADDLVQTALVKTMRRWRHIGHEQPVAYVRRVMVNTQLSWWRRLRPEAQLPDGFDLADRSDAEASYDDQDQLARGLAALPPRQRAVIVLRYYAGMSEAEIADTLGCAPGTVKSQAAKALKTLRRVLADTDGTPEPTTFAEATP
jgi:RNA polymerase sigma-70 factor (sigma-E family)